LNNAVVISQPAVLKATVTPTMVTCNGANDGIISITAPSGGYGTYEYSVNGGTTWKASPLATDSIIVYEVTKMVAERIISEFPVLIMLLKRAFGNVAMKALGDSWV
jgi:hypothetical protein